MLKNYGPSAYQFLEKWHWYTKDDLKLAWPQWGSFEIYKLVYLHAQLENKRSKTKQVEREAYFDWYVEVSWEVPHPVQKAGKRDSSVLGTVEQEGLS